MGNTPNDDTAQTVSPVSPVRVHWSQFVLAAFWQAPDFMSSTNDLLMTLSQMF